MIMLGCDKEPSKLLCEPRSSIRSSNSNKVWWSLIEVNNISKIEVNCDRLNTEICLILSALTYDSNEDEDFTVSYCVDIALWRLFPMQKMIQLIDMNIAELCNQPTDILIISPPFTISEYCKTASTRTCGKWSSGIFIKKYFNFYLLVEFHDANTEYELCRRI